MQGFFANPAFFELVHDRCMTASEARAAKPFATGMLLSTMLAVVTRNSAERVFALQMGFMADAWLQVFYEGLSLFVHRHLNPDAEVELGGAYTKAAGKLKQNLTVEAFISEPDVQGVLHRCLATLQERNAGNAMADQATAELNEYIASNASRIGLNVDPIAAEQMIEFLAVMKCAGG